MTQPVPPEQSSTDSSTIYHWLNSLPEDLSGLEDASIPQHHNFRKRARAPEATEPRRSKRLQLASISGNAMAPKPPVKMPATPQSSGRKKQSQEQAQLLAADLDNPYDPEQTSRPGLLTNVPILNPSSSASNVSPPSPSPRSRSSSPSKGSTQTRSSRNISPDKQMQRLKRSNILPTIVQLGEPGFDIPESLQSLYNDMAGISRGFNVVPEEVRKMVIEAAPKENFQGTFRKALDKKARAAMGARGPLERWLGIQDAYEQAKDCWTDGAPESTWNAEVHSRLFFLALHGHYRARGVWYANITPCQITDPTLLPNIGGISLASKMVDFALVVEPSRHMRQQMGLFLDTRGMSSVNQTDAIFTETRPYACYIETKSSGEGEKKAGVQLVTFLAAHYEKLERLSGKKGTDLPAMPVLTAQGHAWSLMIVGMNSRRQLYLMGAEELGRTSKYLGIYQILAAIQRVAEWVSTDYMNWFAKNIWGGKDGKALLKQS
ncbi:MAG: hypothetical protein Q9167_005311 [Letrouitia subvulpina]